MNGQIPMRKALAGVPLFFVVASLGAATFTVTSTSDSGAGSLRQAILDANANPAATRSSSRSPARVSRRSPWRAR
jgi:hypothetical protein